MFSYVTATRDSRSRDLLKLAAFRREHQLDQLLGDLRLEPFCVSLVETDDIGDHFALLAIRIDGDLSLARRRQESPARTQLIQTAAVIDVAGLGIDDFLRIAPCAALVLLSPVRGLRQAFVIHLTPACLIDEGEIGGRKLAQGG